MAPFHGIVQFAWTASRFYSTLKRGVGHLTTVRTLGNVLYVNVASGHGLDAVGEYPVVGAALLAIAC